MRIRAGMAAGRMGLIGCIVLVFFCVRGYLKTVCLIFR